MSEIKHVGKLRCALENTPEELFFSLVDYRNNLFTSNDPEKIIEFYNGFHNRDQLIQWMKERPKGASYIHEVEGDKDIIVVIPTADFNGKYARTCREEIFKGLHMVFVESGENPDPYFNYAHNCNVGIKRAMEYNPKWVVVSNDDMIKRDTVNKLRDELIKFNSKEVDIVFPFPPARFHSCPVTIVTTYRWLYSLIRIFGTKTLKFKNTLNKKFNVNIHFYRYIPLITKKICTFINFTSFGIFSTTFVDESGGKPFDETFINAFEDLDLSLYIFRNNKIAFCSYLIDEFIHGTLEDSEARKLSTFAGNVYFSYKISNELKNQKEMFKRKLRIKRKYRCSKA